MLESSDCPVVITAVAVYFLYGEIGLLNSYTGMILAHTTLATPFVVIAVTAALIGFDHTLIRAAPGLRAPPLVVFFKIILPAIFLGTISGALFAFLASFGEVVVALFDAGAEQRTLPMVMFSGLREQMSPTIVTAANVPTLFSIAMLTTVELLRRSSQRLCGIRNTRLTISYSRFGETETRWVTSISWISRNAPQRRTRKSTHVSMPSLS